MLFQQKFNTKTQTGITLIETVVGLMMLTVAIGGAAALAVSSLSSTTHTTNQMIATGLAREAQEAVRNMRDTNWLKITDISTDCFDFVKGDNSANCYSKWQLTGKNGGVYNIDPVSSPSSYILDFDPGNASGVYWNFRLAPLSGSDRFRVYAQATTNGQMYSQVVNATPSVFYRKIILSEETVYPYDQDIGPRLKIVAQVWWQDKGCPASADFPGVGKCALELSSYLTNWKNY